jgi:hypothetical protein
MFFNAGQATSEVGGIGADDLYKTQLDSNASSCHYFSGGKNRCRQNGMAQ